MNFTNPSKKLHYHFDIEFLPNLLSFFASFHVKDRLLKTTFRHASTCLSKYGHCLLNSFEPNKMENMVGYIKETNSEKGSMSTLFLFFLQKVYL